MRKPKTDIQLDLSQQITCSVAQAMSMTSLGKTEIYSLLNQQAWESFTLGNRRLIVIASIQRWVEAMSYHARVTGGN